MPRTRPAKHPDILGILILLSRNLRSNLNEAEQKNGLVTTELTLRAD
ncbi:hypothetical protein H8K52_06405 [Undibacterium seohonense]|uniref:Uncharacterized protein n=1 Tax=Undibacterium seohonense TaxID=1344950 RepID=A0ABR6X2A0_9BURK|nr:hypothetical protein [Undibacterium seohonense]MBC3806976.1 hypothetical protein [Undibacterium seohonense]